MQASSGKPLLTHSLWGCPTDAGRLDGVGMGVGGKGIGDAVAVFVDVTEHVLVRDGLLISAIPHAVKLRTSNKRERENTTSIFMITILLIHTNLIDRYLNSILPYFSKTHPLPYLPP